jgi:hypothetical protein
MARVVGVSPVYVGDSGALQQAWACLPVLVYMLRSRRFFPTPWPLCVVLVIATSSLKNSDLTVQITSNDDHGLDGLTSCFCCNMSM